LVYDPEVQLSNLLGANRRYIEQHVPHLGRLIRSDLESLVAESELLIVGLDDVRVSAALTRHVRPDQTILNLVHPSLSKELPGRSVGLCW
jgi:GDP-mannose 6-dehydrogenase